jgi:hypothetical protein
MADAKGKEIINSRPVFSAIKAGIRPREDILCFTDISEKRAKWGYLMDIQIASDLV